ncbi:hypothetical protein TEA_015183 [Camellia sinensis var. sinensis]|uniref:RRM domain-containing protein n=1 Tax=Camellia sinensis var. sinensis TaxID=542762 RepID=A0A4S4D6C0_CAMSN|nr:hypothetical protein TEA_015183 [Camellia sinensis var. sinensis]
MVLCPDLLGPEVAALITNDVSGGHDLPSYFGLDERVAHRFIGDSDSVGASYDRYMRSAQISLYGGGGSARPLTGGLSGHPIDDPRMIGIGGSDPVVTTKSHSIGLGGGRPLPPDASSTLFVEGLPANCTRREVSHIFRPFVGYKEVRLVTKEPRRSGDDPLVLCFVDFASPAHAATAMDALQETSNSMNVGGVISFARFFMLGVTKSHGFPTIRSTTVESTTQASKHMLQVIHSLDCDGLLHKGYRVKREGYKFDEHDRDSVSLQLQFARYPGARRSFWGVKIMIMHMHLKGFSLVGAALRWALHEDEHRTKVTRMSTEPKVTRRGPSSSSTFISGSEASKALQLAS